MDLIYDAIRNLLQNGAQNGWLPEIFKYGFVVNSMICAMIIGPILGAVGTIVVVRRMAFFSSSIGNAAITGIALGILFGEPVSAPYASLTAFALLFALYLNFSRNKTGMSQDTLIAVFLSASIAIGAALMFSVTRKINIHILDSFLFGSILTAGYSDITMLVISGGTAIVLGTVFFNRLMISGLAPDLAEVRGVRVMAINYMFVVLLALVTVASIKIVGAILVEALLIIPAASARNICRSLRGFVIWSVIFGTIAAAAGVILPIQFNISVPSGGAIIICATAIFMMTFMFRLALRRA